jgi:hypothetical protein
MNLKIQFVDCVNFRKATIYPNGLQKDVASGEVEGA